MSKIIAITYVLFLWGMTSYAQNINTIAGTGTSGFSGDGSAATSALLNGPQDVAVDTFGNIYIADAANHRIRKITATTGVIATVAGTGTAGYSGDGAAATSALLYAPIGVAVDKTGNVYIADNGNHCIRKITISTGKISTIAGTGTAGSAGDGGLATSASLYAPYDVCLDTSGNIYIADVSNNKIRKITVSSGIITTIAGTGTPGFSGDGGSATSAKLYQPFSVAVDASGNVFIADTYNSRIRKITATTGTISTIAGTGVSGYSGDGGSATTAQFNTPYSIGLDLFGNIYISDFLNNRVRKITASTGVINTIAGTGVAGFLGDGGLATAAKIAYAKGIHVDKVNNVYIADEGNQRVRFICNAAVIPDPPLVTSPLTLCTGSTPDPLTAVGSLLKWYTTATGGTGTTTAPTPSVASIGTTTYYVSQSSACGESPRSAIVVNVVASPSTPIVSTPVIYCSGTASTALTASGSSLLWYSTASGGTASTSAPTPSTASAGTTVYYVSQGSIGCESPRAAITVQVNPAPSAPTVSDVLYCLGATPSVLSAGGTNLKWYNAASGGTGTTTAPTPSTAVDGTVAYYVTQTNSFSCESPRALLNVRTNTKPIVSITSAAAPKYFVCLGTQLTLKTIVAPYGINYQWQLAGVNIADANKDSFDALTDGLYRVIVSNAPNCNDTASVKVDQDTSLSKTYINPTDVNICDGVNIILFSTSSYGAGYQYQWLKDGVLLSADTLSSLVVSNKGNYQLKVTNSLGCNVLSNTSSVNQYATIPKPVISQSGSVLSVSNTYAKYQWYRNGKSLSGATGNAYDVSFDGDYSVSVSDVNGCKTESDTITIQGLSIQNMTAEKHYKIFPNPTSGIIYIESASGVGLQLIDMLGRTALEQKQSHTLNITSLSDGVYLMYVLDEAGQRIGVEKIVKSVQ
ncbi:MAG: T9SS type A sorting domain-containing protein [Phycisphaerales bacterium]|nr:T9SS type A sorting domain-containing protein [Phycisphaerales bacterium]